MSRSPIAPAVRRRGLSPAEELACRLDRPMGALGLVFVLVILAQMLATNDSLALALSILGWVLWAVFAGEFALRAYVAQDQRRFWKRHWWQLVFLAVPFLRFVRALTVLRAARVGSVVSATVRGSRSATRLLSDRLAWLVVVTVVVILGSSQLLYVAGAYQSYGVALHEAALATITGEPLGADTLLADVIEVALAVYSVGVFATLAGALGAYFLRHPEANSGPAPDRVIGAREEREG